MHQQTVCVVQPDAWLGFNAADTGNGCIRQPGGFKDLFPFFHRCGETQFVVITASDGALQPPFFILLLQDGTDGQLTGVDGCTGMGGVQDMAEVAEKSI